VIQVLAVVGPTGSGKTALALELAERIGTEIISADSMQFYRGMEIGTAAPTPEERARVAHHFASFLAPDEQMAAGPYGELAREVVEALNRRGKPAVVVGGSGLYVAALIDGLFEGPAKNEAIRKRLHAEAEASGNAALYARLQEVDPEYAASLSSENDLIRVVRALEVYEISGEPFSKLHRDHQEQAQPLDAVQVAIDWPREVLYERINTRVERMVEQGWIEEVQRLLADGYGPQLHRLKALGYREIAAYLAGEQSREAALEATKMHHRRYAKRQLSWFRGDRRIQWLEAEKGTATLLDLILQIQNAC
jgi:tRNA dimethylallyltransferase